MGCEAGGLILGLPNCRRRVGADISKAALLEAQECANRRHLENVHFRQLDAQEPLPFRRGEFDVIISSEMLEHVNQPRKVIEHIHAIADSNTRIVVTIPLEGPKLVIKKILKKVGLEKRLKHRVGELSGGEQQRVAIARALIMRPKLLLADEPTGNLDYTTSEGILDLLLQLNQAEGLAMVIATHNRRLADRMSQQLEIVNGRMQWGKQE